MMLDFFKGTVTPKDLLFVGTVLCATALVAVGFYFGIYQKQEAALAATRAELDAAKTSLRKAQQIAQNIDQLRDEAQKMEQIVSLFQQRLPDEREIPMLIKRFEDLGARAGLRVQLTQLPSQTEATKETIPYKVTADGNFHQIVNFINLLERDERYLKVSDLAIDEEKEAVSKATFTLSTFRFIQTAAPAPAPGAAAAAGAKS